MLVHSRRKAFEKARLRLDEIHVAGDRFDDDAGDFTPCALNAASTASMLL